MEGKEKGKEKEKRVHLVCLEGKRMEKEGN